jgi:DHA2 family multidrug resistance protein-like MFS transporter
MSDWRYTFQGRQDNLAIRHAAIIALVFNVFMVLVAIMSITLTVPKARKSPETAPGATYVFSLSPPFLASPHS